MTHHHYPAGSLGHLQSLPQRPAPGAIAFNVREATEAAGTEVLAADEIDAVLSVCEAGCVVRLLRDCLASEDGWTLYVVTLRDGPDRGRATEFKTIEVVVTSEEARP